VNTIIYGKDEEGKKTLVMTHSYLAVSSYWSMLLKSLSQRYRIVLFDHGSWGLNTRLEESAGLDSPEAAENWQIEWILKLFDEYTSQGIVPKKFYFAGHSMGGWLAAQYASQRPDRIESLFLLSPIGTTAYDEKTWDPYS
jgi:pimeloyl-ACP methyl ester carboxylesterase